VISLTNIASVAVYERKTLLRSWFFRIFALLTLLVLFIMNIALFGNEWIQWVHRAVPANVPLINVLYVNVAQAIIAVFLASEFLKRDKKLDTTEVIYARPVSNGEYVVGKTLGILVLFVGLVLLVLLMALVFNLVIKDTPVVWSAYLFYPLLITVPTLIFILGLSFFMMILFRNQALTFIVLLGYIGLTLFYFEDRLHGTLDYMAFNLPMVYSDLIGFSDLQMILLQRGSYFLLGMAFIFATIRFMGRLPQSGALNFVNTAGFVACLLAGLFLSYSYYNNYSQEKEDRGRFLQLNDRYASMKTVDILANDLFIDHEGSGISARATIRFRNNQSEPMDTLLFSLNPGLVIDSILDSSGKAPYSVEDQIVLIHPDEPLQPFSKSTLEFYYHGAPADHFAYLDVPVREREAWKKIHLATVNKDASVCKEEYLLLTPEVLWYPVAGVTFNRLNFLPRKIDFSRFELEVKVRNSLIPVSSGNVSRDSTTYTFRNPNDLDGIALVAGPFEKRSMLVDDTEYHLYLAPGHDYFTDFITEIRDTIPAIITEEKERYEYDELDLYYSFEQVNLVETPVQFHAYERSFTTSTEYIQPEMILLPEKGSGLQSLDLKRGIVTDEKMNRQKENSRSDKEIQLDVFRRLIRFTFFNTENQMFRGSFGENNQQLIEYKTKYNYNYNPYCVFPLYYDKITAISSPEHPIFNAMIQKYLRDGFDVSFRESFRGGTGDREKANLAMKGKTLTEVFNRYGNNMISSVIEQASAFVIQAIQSRITAEDFDYFLYYYIEDHAFSEIPFDRFSRDFREEFGFDLDPYLDFLHEKTNLATFILSPPEYFRTRDDYGDVYIVRMRISNTGENLGLINFSFRMPGGGGFGGGSTATEERIYEIPAEESREVQMVFYEQPRIMTVNTLISGNIPSSFSIFLRSATDAMNMEVEEFDEIRDEAVRTHSEHELIVDNEDPGFSFVSVSNESKLKQYIDSRKTTDNPLAYRSINPRWTPPVWTPVAHSAFYGQSIRSAMISRRGDGNNVARWSAVMPDAGYYDVYTYIPVSAMYKRPENSDRGGRGQGQDRGGGRRGMGPEFADKGTEYHYTVSSNEGSEEVAFLLDYVEEGWNRIGTFHFPSDTATIELSNDCEHGFRVIADAIKWVRKE
jgi:hypothetical protein